MGDSGGSPQNYTVEVHHEFESQPPEYHKRRRSSIPHPDAIEDTITLSVSLFLNMVRSAGNLCPTFAQCLLVEAGYPAST